MPHHIIENAFAAAVRFHRAGQSVSAAAAYRRVLSIAPKHIPALLNFGQLLDREGKLPEAAVFFHRAVKADPHNARAWEALGNALIRLERWDEAEEALRKAVVLVSASSRSWFNLGYVLLQTNRWNESEAAFREAVRLDYPDRVEAWNNLANVLIAQKRWQEAEELLRHAILIDATRRAPWENLTRALLGQNRVAEAAKTRLKVIATQPSPSARRSVCQQDTDDLVSRCLTREGGQLALSADDVRSLHFMLMNESGKDPGEFRRGRVSIASATFFPPSYSEVPALMNEFCTYLNTEWDSSDLFHLGAYANWRISAIHPFYDGNGRIARSLCFALMRAKDGRWRACRWSSDIISKDRNKYVASLKEADRLFEETHDIRLSIAPVERWLREVFNDPVVRVG